VKADGRNRFRLYASAASPEGDLLTRTVKDKTGTDKTVKHWMPLWNRPDPQAMVHVENPKTREAAVGRLAAEFVGAVGWPNRWLRLRAELSLSQLRLWADGLLVASVDWPSAARGGVCLVLNSGARVRRLRVERLPESADGFVPLDLTACHGRRPAPG